MSKRRPSNPELPHNRATHAISARFHWAKRCASTTDPHQKWVVLGVEQRQGEISSLGFQIEDATALFDSLKCTLEGHLVPDARTTLAAKNDDHCARKAKIVSSGAARRKRSRKSDKLVFREMLKVSESRIWRMGPEAALDDLYDAEPELASQLEASLTWVFQQLHSASVPDALVQKVRNDVALTSLTLIAALRKAFYHLWRDTHIGTRLAEIDPKLGKPPPPKADPGAAP